MMNTMQNEVKAVLVHLNQLTGENFLALQILDVDNGDTVGVTFIDKEKDNGFENTTLSYNKDGDVQLLSVDKDKNIVNVNSLTKVILFNTDIQGLKENIEKYGVEKGIQETENNGILVIH